MKKTISTDQFWLGILVKIFQVKMTVLLFSRADVKAVIYSKLYLILVIWHRKRASNEFKIGLNSEQKTLDYKIWFFCGWITF